MIASLPMYDRPETAAANDALWSELSGRLRAAGINAPKRLERDPGGLLDHWLSPELVFSQTCGFPFRTKLAGRVHLVATPIWDLPCPEGDYYSVLVTRVDGDISAPRVAYNEPLSQSGWAALHQYLLETGIEPSGFVQTGAHRASAQAVADKRADLAAIDALTWSMMLRWDDVCAHLQVVGHTPPTPTLPYICAIDFDPTLVRSALDGAICAIGPKWRDVLGLKGVTSVSKAQYLAIPNPPAPGH